MLGVLDFRSRNLLMTKPTGKPRGAVPRPVIDRIMDKILSHRITVGSLEDV